MKNLEQQFSEDLMITQSSESVIDSIPVDLLIDIFSRVPAKSIARFRCVSKFWESILGGPYFKEVFLTKSVARPRLLFALKVDEEMFFFPSPQPQNPDETSSLVATPYKAFPKDFPDKISITYGLVFLYNWGSKSLVICNPVTGESITLPKVKSLGKSHFGFDPINKQFKVLCMTKSGNGKYTHRVLTLEPRQCSWRRFQDPLLPLHSTRSDGIFINAADYYHTRFIINSTSWSTCCDGIFINGIGYYQAYFTPSSKVVVSFDFTSERFSLINMDIDMVYAKPLILFNYKGHLGAHQFHTSLWHKEEFVIWVLEDAENHIWSKRRCVMPPYGEQIVNKNKFVGVSGTGELVFSPRSLSNPFHIFYYNIERNTFARFNIRGFEEFNHHRSTVHTSLDYVENMKFM